jgi:hypothetical protein
MKRVVVKVKRETEASGRQPSAKSQRLTARPDYVFRAQRVAMLVDGCFCQASLKKGVIAQCVGMGVHVMRHGRIRTVRSGKRSWPGAKGGIGW